MKRINWEDRYTNRKPPAVDPAKPKPSRYSRQKRNSRNGQDRGQRDTEYLVLRDIYLEENPECDYQKCQGSGRANQVHHICRGNDKAKSLLNQNTWLGACCQECHDAIEKLTPAQQIKIKQQRVRSTIERLRR